jgi:sulfate adenylyltransferase
MSTLIAPHGGVLSECLLSPDSAEALKRAARDFPSWDVTPRQLCDLELLLNGGFSPLTGFMTQADYTSVVQQMRLDSGLLWPMPIVLDVTEAFSQTIAVGAKIALRDPEGVLMAVLHLSDLFRPDRTLEAQRVYGTADPFHPGVDFILNKTHPVYLGGKVEGVQLPSHYDFKRLRATPREIRDRFTQLGWRRIVAFQTRNPMHRAHQELTFRAAQRAEANLLIHPVVGMTRPGDIDHYSRTRCYEQLLKQYPEQTTILSLLHLAMRMAGPREAVWHAIIRKNHGCTHFIVGRDHAGPGKDRNGKDFYGPYDAQEMVAKYQKELGIEMVPFQEMVYVQELAGYLPDNEVVPGQTVLNISGTEFRRRLREGLEIPEWFSYPEVVAELRRGYPPRHGQGFAIFFTGLSGAGKSTIANALMVKLLEMGNRSVTLLDGDLVRKHLSSELGFSMEHRNLNILRIGYVASEIAKHGGVAICAPIAPYRITRRKVREMIAEVGGFVEVYVATPIDVCETRDRKGLYAKARAGLIQQFTGVNDPYEVPEAAELSIDTRECTPDEAAQRILLKLEGMGYIR